MAYFSPSSYFSDTLQQSAGFGVLFVLSICSLLNPVGQGSAFRVACANAVSGFSNNITKHKFEIISVAWLCFRMSMNRFQYHLQAVFPDCLRLKIFLGFSVRSYFRLLLILIFDMVHSCSI
jgi:hypothetical protein